MTLIVYDEHGVSKLSASVPSDKLYEHWLHPDYLITVNTLSNGQVIESKQSTLKEFIKLNPEFRE